MASKAAQPVATGKDKEMQDWDAHADLRTLIEAAKIHKDKPRHKRAMSKHQEMMAALQHIAQQAQQGQQPAGPEGAPPAGLTANGGAY